MAFIERVNNSVFWRWGLVTILIVILFNAYSTSGEKSELIFCLKRHDQDYEKNPLGIFKGQACRKVQLEYKEAAIFIGSVNDAKNTEFSLFRNAHPDINTMCFHSPGGSIRAARALSNELQKASFNTCMAEQYYYPPVYDYDQPLSVAG